MEFYNLRKKYTKFIYKKYKIEEDEKNIYLKYDFEIEGLEIFQPVLTIVKKNFKWNDIYQPIVQNIAFHIGLIEAISYWKVTCSKNFYITCGKLKEEQIKWFQKLIYLGLGEFRYRNQIKVSQNDFVCIISEGNELNLQKIKSQLNDIIIPIGGGKDSNVTLELLKETNYKRFGFRINMEDVSKKCAEIAGLCDDEIIEVKRKIDSNLLKLNKKGFLNGHTPFSALVAFITYFVAVLLDKEYIALSNEESSNQSNIKGENINHQYSKSFEFENDFRKYVKTYISPNGPKYFSFLRPLNELQIAKLFSKLEPYHAVFKSCNVGSKSKPWKWCCNCAKCLFPYIMLSPFISQEKLINIFGENLLEKESLLQTFIELCGYGENKPFECVGTYEETRCAVSQVIQNTKGKLPFLLEYYQEHFKLVNDDMLRFYNKNHNVPKDFEKILKGKIGSC